MIPVLKDAVVYANLILMLTIGFTLVYLTAKIPNFAHGTYAGIGVYVTFTVVKLWGLNPYIAMPTAFVIGAGLGVFIYKVIIHTLRRFGATLISLTVSTLALEIIMIAVINIYAEYIRITTGIYTWLFLLRPMDFKFMELPGVLIVSTILIALLIISIHLMLTKTRFGISLRATVEDPDLASVLGTNVELVSTVSWALTGGLAGLAGSLLPLWFQGHPYVGTWMMTTVFAASALGGFSSVYGAMLGGYLVGLTEILGTVALTNMVGGWIAAYRMLIPLIMLAAVLLKTPRGIAGFIEDMRARGLSMRSIVRLGRVRSEK